MNQVSQPYHLSKERISIEADLIRQAKQDPSKFAALYDTYYEQIFMFIMRRVATADEANDVTSQVFLKVMTNLSKYKDMGLPFSSWLYRIARNELYDLHLKNKINLFVSVESKGIAEMISEFGETKMEEDYSRLHKSLTLLDDDEMELIEMRFFEKRQFKEIAEILEITESNARVKTFRILDKLKKLLNNER